MAAPSTSAPLPPSFSGNRLLRALSPPLVATLVPALVPLPLRHGQVLHEPEQPITQVYFPLSAVVSQLTLLADGEAVETGIIGEEGFVGHPLLYGLEQNHNRLICQVAGRALQLPAATFRALLGVDTGELRELLGRYLASFSVQVSQTSACSRSHPLPERCARWLLHVHDRVGTDRFQLTQEFLANMLGVRRPSVTVVASTLGQAGLITYRHGTITVLDRAGLEAATCECYTVIVQALDALVGPPAARPAAG